MEYNLLVNKEKVNIETEITNDDIQATINGNSYRVSWNRISDSQLHLVVNGKSMNVYTSGTENKTVILDGRSYNIVDTDHEEQSRSRKKSHDSNPADVTPPMPAVVISVDVNEGDSVDKGAGVIVVSAMKMESTLFAPYSGIVTKIHTDVGAKVMPGDILVDIQKEEPLREK